MRNLIIIGTSSTARTVCAFVKQYNLFHVRGFAVNRQYIQKDTFCGLPVYAIEDLGCLMNKDEDFLFVALQWNRLNADRRKVYEELKGGGFRFANLISPHAVVCGTIAGDNVWIHDLAAIDFGATIGNNTFVKIGAVVGPNTTVSDHCFIGIHATIAGGVTVGEQTFVGVNATIFDCVRVGQKCIVGAATVVKRNMPDYSKSLPIGSATPFKQYAADEVEGKLMFSKNVR